MLVLSLSLTSRPEPCAALACRWETGLSGRWGCKEQLEENSDYRSNNFWHPTLITASSVCSAQREPPNIQDEAEGCVNSGRSLERLLLWTRKGALSLPEGGDEAANHSAAALIRLRWLAGEQNRGVTLPARSLLSKHLCTWYKHDEFYRAICKIHLYLNE